MKLPTRILGLYLPLIIFVTLSGIFTAQGAGDDTSLIVNAIICSTLFVIALNETMEYVNRKQKKKRKKEDRIAFERHLAEQKEYDEHIQDVVATRLNIDKKHVNIIYTNLDKHIDIVEVNHIIYDVLYDDEGTYYLVERGPVITEGSYNNESSNI